MAAGISSVKNAGDWQGSCWLTQQGKDSEALTSAYLTFLLNIAAIDLSIHFLMWWFECIVPHRLLCLNPWLQVVVLFGKVVKPLRNKLCWRKHCQGLTLRFCSPASLPLFCLSFISAFCVGMNCDLSVSLNAHSTHTLTLIPFLPWRTLSPLELQAQINPLHF